MAPSSISFAGLVARGVGLLGLLLFAVAPALAQAGSWQVHQGPDAPHTVGTTVADGQSDRYLRGAEIPPTSDPAWASASAGELTVTTPSNSGAVALQGDRFVGWGTVDDLVYDDNGTDVRATSALADG